MRILSIVPVGEMINARYFCFGDPDKPKRIMSIEGIGFYLDKAPEYSVRRFFQNHKDTFCQSEKNIEIYNRLVIEKNSLEDAFLHSRSDFYFVENDGGAEMWQLAVLDIINHETDLDVSYWKADDIPHNRPVIMVEQHFPEDYNEYTRSLTKKEILKILDGYAREAKTYASLDVFHLMMVDL